MAKDPNYDRYAGIVSLPGPDGKLPRPFRVDEDGNVIYRDEGRGIGRPMSAGKSRDLARAGILSWNELDRKLDDLSAPPVEEVLATPSRKLAGAGGASMTRKTIGGRDYNVISANTFDPARSNGKTAIPNGDMIATAISGRNRVAGSKPPEKGEFIVRLSQDFGTSMDGSPNERNLPLTNPKQEMYYTLPVLKPKAWSTDDADMFSFGKPRDWPVGTAALNHGHIDGRSAGMADEWEPSSKTYGDVESLRLSSPLPTFTESEGHVGWHQLDNGRLQFVYPVGIYSDKDDEDRMIKRMQENIDYQQSLFQRK